MAHVVQYRGPNGTGNFSGAQEAVADRTKVQQRVNNWRNNQQNGIGLLIAASPAEVISLLDAWSKARGAQGLSSSMKQSLNQLP